MSFSFLPHADIVLTQIRTNDIWILLSIGATWEFLTRLLLLVLQRKSSVVLQREYEYQQLQKQVHHKRQMGPSAFVETSKLERQLLQLEKIINDDTTQRKARHAKIEKMITKTGSMIVSALVYVMYYGIPIVTFDALEVSGSLGEYIPADTYLKTLLFPISVIGIGNKVSKWGLGKLVASSSLSALMVLWSSQVTMKLIMDAVDSYVLY